MVNSNYYKVGGSLEYQHPTYVVRQADHDLYEGLKNGEFCYVLNSRQMGKSSLRVQMMKRLKEEGVKCAAIDMTRIGSHVTPNEWYGGVVSELIRGFGLSRKVDFGRLWQERNSLSPLQRLGDFIEDVLLTEIPGRIVIFIDEIDSILKVSFKCDFFAFLRGCYNHRADNPDYNRLTFCLLGVASPSDLITDKSFSTPFNIGRAIDLQGFQLKDVEPLYKGLEKKTNNPQKTLQEILIWTGGQPFLTQKICKLIAISEVSDLYGQEAQFIEDLIQIRIINNWEAQDEPEHLRTVRDRILHSLSSKKLLSLYKEILCRGSVIASDESEQMELRLSGLVVRRGISLCPYNKIYQSVFNKSWIKDNLVQKTSSQEYPARLNAFLGNDLVSKIQSLFTHDSQTNLSKLLSEKRWLEADLLTTIFMLIQANRLKEGWLRGEDIENFSCFNIRRIDELWRESSGGKFGFSIQSEIWKQLGGTRNSSAEVYYEFCKKIGWIDETDDFLSQKTLIFDISAPPGHLPGCTLSWLWESFSEMTKSHDLEHEKQVQDFKEDFIWWEILNSISENFSKPESSQSSDRFLIPEVDLVAKLKEKGFTSREIIVFFLRKLRYTYREIANMLHIEINSVKKIVKNINMKLYS